MRRLALAALLPVFFIGCDNPFSVRKKLESVDAPVVRPGTRDPQTGRYIPPVCASNGSYEQAVNCFRQAPVMRFRMPDGQGMVTRNSAGRERMVLYVASGDLKGSWTAEIQKAGVVWTLNDARVDVVPARVARIFEWVIRFPGPKKDEAAPLLIGRDEESIVYEFSGTGSEVSFVVRVDPKSGHIRQLTGAGMDLTFG